MSQQGAGADDWWQKLYEDPDAVPEADPGDTLDKRFHSASSLTTPPGPPAPAAPEPAVPAQAPPGDPAAGPGPVPAPRPAPPEPQALPWEAATPEPEPPQAGYPAPPPFPAPPGQAPESATGLPGRPPIPTEGRQEPAPQPFPAPPGQAPADAQAQAPAQAPAPTSDRQVPVRPPFPAPLGQAPAPASDRQVPVPPPFPAPPGEAPVASAPEGGLPVRPVVPPAAPGRGLVPGPRPAPEPLPPVPPAPPRDPRAGGVTGYALGDVDVPAWRAEDDRTTEVPAPAPQGERPAVRHLGDRAPTYAAEPGALPVADPAALDALTPDTVLEGAQYGTYALRAVSLRGDSARFRGEARRDFLLTARFGSGDDALVMVALAGGDRAAPGAPEAAAELCRTVAAAVGRSQERLADDIRAGRRDALRSGLQRLTDRGYGRLRARAAELGLAEQAYTAGLRALLLPVDPECRTRVCFGAGAGGLFRLRSGEWQDLEPDEGAEDGDFRFRASVARPGDTLLVCSGGLAEPMREEALLPAELAARWAEPEPPGLAAFLADTQLRLKGYADDRTAAAVWEA
ncbi:protein phosphatase 2C domain-containing protein [Streptomyces sp. NPDC059874]|uniref:protein phosphatase 2C domain-containing protein n=1 Tax=Streptomyces sp. NPDC059874 TaxID=3346983 RepID=UPI00364849E2